jgi:hypothetical protein
MLTTPFITSVDELLAIAENNDGFVTATEARAAGIKDSVLAPDTTWKTPARGKRCLPDSLFSVGPFRAVSRSGALGES